MTEEQTMDVAPLTVEERFALQVAVDRVYAIPAPRSVHYVSAVPNALTDAVEQIVRDRLASVSALADEWESVTYRDWGGDLVRNCAHRLRLAVVSTPERTS